MVPLSDDLRQRIIDTWRKHKSLSNEELAERFAVGPATVGRLKRRFRESGSVAPKPHGGGQPRKISPEKERIVEALLQAHPDWSEDRYAEVLEREHGLKVSPATVGRTVRRLGYSVKKSPSSPPKRTSPTLSGSGSNTKSESETSPLRVWFLWTKRARTSR
jgi:transposase